MKILVALLFALCAAAPAWSWTGQVQEAASGDALLLRDADGAEVLVRLYGTETRGPAEPEGQAARRALDELCRGRDVDVLPLLGEGSRQTGHVLLDLQDLSREMARLGLAWVDWPGWTGPVASRACAAPGSLTSSRPGPWAWACDGTLPCGPSPSPSPAVD